MKIARRISLLVIGALVVATGAAMAGSGSMNPTALLQMASSGAMHAATDDDAASDDDSASGVSRVSNTNKHGKQRSGEATGHGKQRSRVGCPEGFTGTHGQFVSQAEDKNAAAHSPCGKPVKAQSRDRDGDDSDGDTPGQNNAGGSDNAATHRQDGAHRKDGEHRKPGRDSGANHPTGQGGGRGTHGS